MGENGRPRMRDIKALKYYGTMSTLTLECEIPVSKPFCHLAPLLWRERAFRTCHRNSMTSKFLRLTVPLFLLLLLIPLCLPY